jgi:hypothetical protein
VGAFAQTSLAVDDVNSIPAEPILSPQRGSMFAESISYHPYDPLDHFRASIQFLNAAHDITLTLIELTHGEWECFDPFLMSHSIS